MSLTDMVVYRDDSLVTLVVRCTCAVGEHDEEETPPGFEIVLPLAGGLVRRAGAVTSLVDAAWGYLAQPKTPHEIVHLSDGDRRSLGSVAGYAPHHLSRVFRSTTGMTLSAYRDRVRLGRAMALLQDGMPVADVAAELGYFDHAHLTRRATQLLGVAPSALRSPNRAPMSKRSP